MRHFCSDYVKIRGFFYPGQAMEFIIKLFPEITIKSKPVRQRLVKQLRQNVQVVLGKHFDGVKVQGFWDKVEVRLVEGAEHQGEAVARTLQDIPGIANILRVQSYTVDNIDDNFDAILQLCKNAFAEQIAGKRFVVRIKRTGDHRFTSHELERYIGGGLLKETDALGVDLKNADYTVKLEVRNNDVHLVEERYEGLGGYPMGTQDPVLSLISGGFDSTVSSYLTMKRGLKTHFCFFNLGGAAHEIGVKQVSLYLWERYGISHRVKFVTVNFEDVVGEILKNVHHSQMGVVLKRMMMRAASEVAKRMDVAALVTGESVAQVSSQTLANLSVIDEVTNMLTLRPLVTMDKLDIIRIAANIGTEEFAKNMPEYCGVISDRPTTRATLQRIEEEEAKFDFAVLDKAINEREILKIDQVMASQKTIANVDLVAVPDVNDVIIDIRHPDEQEKHPLELTNNRIEPIAFYELMSSLDKLDKAQSYLLYCEQGTMSQLHASHLKGMGYEQMAVYLPKDANKKA